MHRDDVPCIALFMRVRRHEASPADPSHVVPNAFTRNVPRVSEPSPTPANKSLSLKCGSYAAPTSTARAPPRRRPRRLEPRRAARPPRPHKTVPRTRPRSRPPRLEAYLRASTPPGRQRRRLWETFLDFTRDTPPPPLGSAAPSSRAHLAISAQCSSSNAKRRRRRSSNARCIVPRHRARAPDVDARLFPNRRVVGAAR